MRTGRFLVPATGIVRPVVVFVCMAVLTIGAPASAGVPVKVISSDASRLIFEVSTDGFRFVPSHSLAGTERLEIPGFGPLSGEGEPQLPGRYYTIALPPDGGYSFRHTVIRSQPLGSHRLEPAPSAVAVRDGTDFVSTREIYRIDDSVYLQKRYTIGVSDAGVSRVRHQRVLSLRVDPVGHDPSTGETVIGTVIRVEVSFTGAGRSRPGRGGIRRPAPESPVWDRILSGMLVNPGQARGWRVKPLRPAGASGRASRAMAGPVVKLKVRKSGLHRVSASSVVAEGFPPGTAVGDLHLFKSSYDEVGLAGTVVDVTYAVVEDPSGTAGVFDGRDDIVFYGQQLREDTLRDDPIQKFADDNVYWLGDSTGPQMGVKIVAPGFVSADTLTASFPATRHFEQDLWFREETPPFERDFYYYHGDFIPSFSAPFALDAIVTSGLFRIRARFLGANLLIATRTIDVRIVNSKGTTVLPSVSVPGNSLVNYDSGLLQASSLVEGLNSFQILPNAGNQVTVLDALLNHFDIDYPSPYRAKGNVLEFHTAALAGDTSLTVTGLDTKNVMLFDITDPLAPRECQLNDSHFTPDGGGFILSFRETITSQRRFIVSSLDKMTEITGADVVSDVAAGLIGNPAEAGVDVLVVAHTDFLGGMGRWVDYRRGQGYRVLMADADEIYDEFNGGVRHPRAIRRFVHHFFELGNASFVLLVGDGSEDNKTVHRNESGINFVPSESFTEFVGAGFNEDEVVTTDKWYVTLNHDYIKNLPPVIGANPLNFIPSLIIGRLPAGSDAELRVMLDKIFLFEQPSGSDFWRRRMIRVADDAWSFSSLTNTCFQPPEVAFERAEAVAADSTENSLPGGFDVVRFFLSDRIAHPLQGTCISPFTQQQRTRMNATPALISELNQGATVVSFQAHMNRFAICHEFLFTSSNGPADGGSDYLKMANTGRPWIVFAMGCHLSDYAVHRELNRFNANGPTGDCLSELLLFRNNAGAVATYGSTGFEYLSTNISYTDIITKSFHVSPPTDTLVASNRAQARWIFGELMTRAELVNLAQRGAIGPGKGAVGMTIRYHILGDPLLRIDGGPPRFDVTVNGNPFQPGAQVNSDSIVVRAIITDEVAIEKITLLNDNMDVSNQLTRTPLVDQTLSAARQYEVTFGQKIVPGDYQIVLQAHQAVDTTGTNFHMVGEFVFQVSLNAALTVNGRPLVSGDAVPPEADYLFELSSGATLDTSRIHVKIDGTRVPANITLPVPGDSIWLITFSTRGPASLSQGPHTIAVFVDAAGFPFQVVVSSQLGLRDIVAYPNPFQDQTQFVYNNDVAITGGSIEVFTTSGKKVARLAIPPSARAVGQNAVTWDGRTFSGDEIANGLYLFVIRIDQGGRQSVFRGKLVHAK